MSQAEKFTQAQLIDPGMVIAQQQPEQSLISDILVDIDNNNRRSSGNRVVALVMAGASLGVFGGVAALMGDSERVVSADELCGPGMWHDGLYYNGRPICNPFPPPATTTNPTNPPVETLPPTPTSPPSGGGSNSGGTNTTTRPTTPTTTSPFSELNQDGDSWPITINKNTGEIVGGWDIDDSSPGLGDEGIARLQSEMLLRGLDINAMTDAQRLAAMTTNPDQWSVYLSDILGVATTTTTITVASVESSAPAETEVEAATDTTETDATTTELAAESLTPTTEDKSTAAVVDADSNDGSGNNRLIAGGVIVLSALGFGALVAAARRRSKNKSQTPPQAFGESPVAGM